MKNKIINAFVNALFPPRCFLCDEIITPESYLCLNCQHKLTVPDVKRCIGCGVATEKCECDRFIYHFDGVISPFFNEGAAKQGIYSYKFFRQRRIAEFYAKHMAHAVQKYYKDIKFDFITFVCSSKKKQKFEHCRLLTKELSANLNLRVVDALISTDKPRSTQHKLGFENRFENVHNAYKAKIDCRAKNILLVDDIKTSGATIDECARILKIAGAKSVYCVTAVVGNR